MKKTHFFILSISVFLFNCNKNRFRADITNNTSDTLILMNIERQEAGNLLPMSTIEINFGYYTKALPKKKLKCCPCELQIDAKYAIYPKDSSRHITKDINVSDNWNKNFGELKSKSTIKCEFIINGGDIQ
ncbi:MAG: hypothetical protein V4580_00885 [Bacteroidota bacterium]